MSGLKRINRFPWLIQTAVWFVIFIGLTLVVYRPSMNGPFIFDDKPNIELNPHIRLTTLSFEGLLEAGFKGPCGRRPVPKISFSLNYFIHRYRPFGYHLVNVLIHVLNAVTMVIVLRRTLELVLKSDVQSRILNLSNVADDRRGWWLAGSMAALWLVHPLQTQSVSYIVQRMNSLATLFYLISIALYLAARSSRRPLWKWMGWIGCGVSGLLAMGSKEIALTLPVFLFLYEWFFFQNLDGQWLKRNLKWIATSAILAALVLLIYTNGDPFEAVLKSYEKRSFTLFERLLTQPRVIFFYIGLFLFPHPSRLNLDHFFSVSHSLVNPITSLVAVLCITALTGVAVFLAKRDRFLSFGLLWLFGNLAVESSVYGLEMVFEHRLYLPSVMGLPVFLLLIHRWIPRPVFFAVFCLGIGLVFSVWTFERNRVWGDELLLWQDAAKKTSQKPRPMVNLGKVYSDRGEKEKALTYYQKALKLDPDFADAHFNIGVLADEAGELENAISHYRSAIQSRPDFPQAYNNLGLVFAHQGMEVEAERCFRKAIKIKPDLVEAHSNLADLFVKRGNRQQAILQLQNALEALPRSGTIHDRLARLYLEAGIFREAVVHYARAFQLQPDSADACNNLGVALAQVGKKEEAIDFFREALRLDPGHTDARRNLALATGG